MVGLIVRVKRRDLAGRRSGSGLMIIWLLSRKDLPETGLGSTQEKATRIIKKQSVGKDREEKSPHLR